MPESPLNGVSTRNYSKVMPEMADSFGSTALSREFIEAREAQLKALCERRFDGHCPIARRAWTPRSKQLLGVREARPKTTQWQNELPEDLIAPRLAPPIVGCS